uniref:Uncharacterized protein n=1 Tax=viral metagenome TaxID=1070528 RepID=A0A6M3IUI6_9ZZZZ
MADTDSVQGETPEVAVPEGTTEQPSETVEQQVARLVAEKTNEITRKFQSEKDREIAKSQREVADAQRRAQQYQNILSSSKQALGELDPEMAVKVRLAELEAKERLGASFEQQEIQRRKFEETQNAFTQNLRMFIESDGLDPNDKRLDWGTSSEPLLTRQQKVLASVSKIHKDDAKTVDDRIKDRIAEERKEKGLDSVDVAQGAASSKMTAASFARDYNDLDKRAEMIKNVDKIYKDFTEGKIK